MLRIRVDARQALALRVGDRTRHAIQQHVRVSQDRIERGPEFMRHVGQELRFQGGGLLESNVLPSEQFVLRGEFGRRLLDLPFQFGGGILQLLEQSCLLESLGQVVQDRDDPHQLPLLRQDLAGQSLDRREPPADGIGELNFAAISLLPASREDVRNERRQVRTVGAHTPQLQITG